MVRRRLLSGALPGFIGASFASNPIQPVFFTFRRAIVMSLPNSEKVKQRCRSRFLVVLLLFLQAPSAFPAPESLSPVQLLEYQLKSAFLYRIAKFVDWPDSAFQRSKSALPVDVPFTFCVADDRDFMAILSVTVGGRTVLQHHATVMHLDDIADPGDCQVIYFHRSSLQTIRERMSVILDRPVLTIGNHPGFIDAGGMIRFLVEQNRLGFEINNRRAVASGLAINAHLLRLGRVR